MMTRKYVLDNNGNPIFEPDLYKWSKWFETSRHKRIVKHQRIGESRVSTVFLAIDYGWDCKQCGKRPAILWETMVFGGPLDQKQDRCSGNREQAQAMHNRMVQRVKEKLRK